MKAHIQFTFPIALLAALLVAPLHAADDNQPPSKPPNSLDDDLLKGLGDDPLLDDLLTKPTKKPDEKKPDDKQPTDENPAQNPTAKPAQPPADDLDQQLLDGLLDDVGLPVGEDVGQPSDPLIRAGRNMREAAGRIAKTKTDDETQQLQQRILEDLEALIKQARKQQQQKKQSSSQSQQARRNEVKQAKPSQGRASSKPSDSPANDSTNRLGQSELDKLDRAQQEALVKRLWGNLPEKERERMLQNPVDQFLPKYEILIGEYFKTLAEQQQNQR